MQALGRSGYKRQVDVNQGYISIITGAEAGLYTDVEIKNAEYDLIVSKNDLIKSTLDFLLIDLKIKKYSSDLNIQSIKTINQMLVW